MALSAAVAAMLGLVSVSRAGETPTVGSYLAALSTTTQAELPAKAADLVARASAKQQSQTTVDVVKAAVGLNPAAAPAIVGSIAQTTPAMAAIAASTAAGLVPGQATAIARVAAAAAPGQAGKIVEALCRVLPGSYQELAKAVAEMAPGASKDILGGVAAAIPSLKEPINKILLASKDAIPSVNSVLEQVKADVAAAALLAPTPNGRFAKAGVNPVVTPPYVPPPASPVNLDPGSGGQVPPGGRVYSQP